MANIDMVENVLVVLCLSDKRKVGNTLQCQKQTAVPLFVFAWCSFESNLISNKLWNNLFSSGWNDSMCFQSSIYFQVSLAGGHIYAVSPSFHPAEHLRRTCWQTLKWTAWLCFLAETQFLPCGAANGQLYQSSYGLHNDGRRSGGMLNPDYGSLGGTRGTETTLVKEL